MSHAEFAISSDEGEFSSPEWNLQRGATLQDFVVVGPDRPFARVYEEVAQQITSLATGLDDPNRGTHSP